MPLQSWMGCRLALWHFIHMPIYIHNAFYISRCGMQCANPFKFVRSFRNCAVQPPPPSPICCCQPPLISIVHSAIHYICIMRLCITASLASCDFFFFCYKNNIKTYDYYDDGVASSGTEQVHKVEHTERTFSVPVRRRAVQMTFKL